MPNKAVGPEPHRQPPLWRQLRQAATALEQRLLASGQSRADLAAPVEDLLYAGMRAWGLTQVRLKRLVRRQPSGPVACLLSVAFGALRRGYRENAVVVDQTVRAARDLGGEPTARFVNGLLRGVLRDPSTAALDEQQDMARFNAPDWWTAHLRRQFDETTLAQLAHAMQSPPPFCLRYLDGREPATVFSKPMSDLLSHPDWQAGRVRVQDQSAQALDGLLPLKTGQTVLDACAAPGGKSILMAAKQAVSIWAIDASAYRLERMRREVDRVAGHLKGSIKVCQADLTLPWEEQMLPPDLPQSFDYIVLDAPCSASGVARRHPDGPWRRDPQQLEQTLVLQARLLDALWPRLRPGGQMVYVTCSIFESENQQQVDAFMRRHSDAQSCPAPGLMLPFAKQEEDGIWVGQDGFFYARFEKKLTH
ncbi:MAG: SAM-dependent methyltransferase [Burkholderiaceae bacterium]